MMAELRIFQHFAFVDGHAHENLLFLSISMHQHVNGLIAEGQIDARQSTLCCRGNAVLQSWALHPLHELAVTQCIVVFKHKDTHMHY